MGEVDVTFILQVDRFGSCLFREGFQTAFSNTVSCFVFKVLLNSGLLNFELLPSVSCAVMFTIGYLQT